MVCFYAANHAFPYRFISSPNMVSMEIRQRKPFYLLGNRTNHFL